MALHVDNFSLREAQNSRDLALRLRQISMELSIEQATTDLLAAIKSEALPPDVFGIYLSAVECPLALAEALRQPFSRFVRYGAIKQFGQALKKPNWASVWDEVGGTNGLLQLLSELSVFEVKLLCKAIGWAAQKPTDESTLKQQRVTELLQGLLPKHFPESPHQSQDDRPLHNRYACLLPACTSDFIKKLVMDDGGPFEWDQWPIRCIAQKHWPMLQRLVLTTLRYHNFPTEGKTASREGATRSFIQLFLPFLLHDIPQTVGHRQGFSASMSFSLEVLRSVVQGTRCYFEEGNFEQLLVMPLIHRALSRKVDLYTMQEIFNLVLSYLEMHPHSLTSSQTWDEESFSAYVAKSWSKQSRQLEKQLVAALKFQSLGKPDAFPETNGIFKAVDRKDRHDLLRLIILHGHRSKADITKDSDLRNLSVKQWPLSVFQNISVKEAHKLLCRLTRLKSEGNFLQLPRHALQPSILAQPPSLGLSHGDPVLLSILLDSDKQAAIKDAQKCIEHQRELSLKIRDQATRAFHAKSAAFYAIASGSLDLYDQIMVWSRRYVRDPPSLKTIYSSEAVNTKEGVALLTGIPKDLSHCTANDICQSVVRGNEVLVNIFETAILALNEPSFSVVDWCGPKSLFRDVVAARVEESRRLKSALGLSESNVYDILWGPTLKMLLKVEKIGLQPGHEHLCFNVSYGPLRSYRIRCSFSGRSTFGAASYRFLDDLARARNELWEKYRPTVQSDCASLPKEWPRGLPIQALIGDFMYAIHDQAAKPHTPYISSRSHAIVFLEQNPFIKQDDLGDERRYAIGRFVDSYETALQVQVLQQKPGREQEDQASTIVEHVLNLYCSGDSGKGGEGHLSKYEAVELCKPMFRRALRGMKIATIDEFEERYTKGYPILPENQQNLDPQERLEWNPIEGRSQKVTTRQVTATLLDCMIAEHSTVFIPFKVPLVQAINTGHAYVWSSQKIDKSKSDRRAVQEATIVSALLFLESKIATMSTILTSAFPSIQDIRYPPLFLDQEFLEYAKYEKMARQAISALICKVPSTLLHNLSNNALDSLSDPALNPTESSSRDRTAFGLLRLLLQCDRPELASNGIITTLIDRPEASSWHRQLLKKSYIRKLSKSQAQTFIDSFVASIHAKLDEQTRLRESRQASVESHPAVISDSPPKPIIKITTIKFLAQFLNDVDAVSTEASVQMLSDLLKKSSHIDVRVAVIESLLSKLVSYGDESAEEAGEYVFQAFERCIPIMGSLDGSRALDEQDWRLAEQAGNLPEVESDGALSQTAPIFEKFCTSLAGLSMKQSAKLLTRVLLPALSRSQANNRRWVSLFAQKFNLASSYHDLPALPVHPQVLILLIHSSLYKIPSWILDLHHQHALINLKTPGWLVDFNKRLRNDQVLRDSNAVQHWLYLYDRGPDIISTSSASLTRFLQDESQLSIAAPEPDGICVSHVQKYLVEQACALLWLRDPNFTHWNQFFDRLGPPLHPAARYDAKAAWLTNVKPVIEEVIVIVDSMRRSTDWQHRPFKTDTAFLPSLFPLRLLLLDYPQLHPYSSMEDNVARFWSQLLGLLREVQGLGLAHREKLALIAGAAAKADWRQKILLVCLAGEVRGRLEGKNGEEIALRAEIADILLQDLNLEEEDVKRIGAVVRGWVWSGDEGLRVRGVRVGRRMGLDVEKESLMKAVVGSFRF